MPARLIDQIVSPEGFMIGISYVLAWTAVVCAVAWVMDRYEHRRMDRAIARAVEQDRRQTAEDAARWTP